MNKDRPEQDAAENKREIFICFTFLFFLLLLWFKMFFLSFFQKKDGRLKWHQVLIGVTIRMETSCRTNRTLDKWKSWVTSQLCFFSHARHKRSIMLRPTWILGSTSSSSYSASSSDRVSLSSCSMAVAVKDGSRTKAARPPRTVQRAMRSAGRPSVRVSCAGGGGGCDLRGQDRPAFDPPERSRGDVSSCSALRPHWSRRWWDRSSASDRERPLCAPLWRLRRPNRAKNRKGD